MYVNGKPPLPFPCSCTHGKCTDREGGERRGGGIAGGKMGRRTSEGRVWEGGGRAADLGEEGRAGRRRMATCFGSDGRVGWEGVRREGGRTE